MTFHEISPVIASMFFLITACVLLYLSRRFVNRVISLVNKQNFIVLKLKDRIEKLEGRSNT